VLKMIFPGVCVLEFAGDPPGNTHEYFAAMEVVLKETGLPAVMVTSAAGDVIVPRGGGAAYDES
jgi:hypothetical protein